MTRRLIFLVAILASSFLIFLVQPMVGKRLLPWFGGAPSVWTVCLAFYQTTLFLGYAYAHLLIRYASPVAQLTIHAGVVTAAFWSLPVLPELGTRATGLTSPTTQILGMLASHVALPFLTLASTGPLVQTWFARLYPTQSPYPLYALSNLGSFAALFAYPLVFEPRLSLSLTGMAWAYAFAATASCVLVCAFLARRMQPHDSRETGLESDDTRPLAEIRIVLWISLSGSAVVLLMGVTNSLTLDIASVPFLWILPLATYLATFILCFASERYYHRTFYGMLTMAALYLTLGLPVVEDLFGALVVEGRSPPVFSAVRGTSAQVVAYCALLFGGCMLMHGELYRLRPPSHSLTAFYLCISGGGALGGLFVGMIAPVVFNDYHETPVGLALVALLTVAAAAFRNRAGAAAGDWGWRWKVGMPIVLLVGMLALAPRVDPNIERVHTERSFFGVLFVAETVRNGRVQRQLVSGSTIHGVQFFGRAGLPRPSSYYGQATGIAAAMNHRRHDRPLNVGLIGLGVGTLSAYGRIGDRFRYYEIDPAVVHIARDTGLFTFVEQSLASVEIVVGDGRLELSREQARSGKQQFDYLILDAFSSDAIPIHLLTVEAFRVYSQALASTGVLAAHVSNRNFDLLPLVAKVGREAGLSSLVVATNVARQYQSQRADWILLSRDITQLEAIAESLALRTARFQLPNTHVRTRQPTSSEFEDVPIWTDDHSDLLAVLRKSE